MRFKFTPPKRIYKLETPQNVAPTQVEQRDKVAEGVDVKLIESLRAKSGAIGALLQKWQHYEKGDWEKVNQEFIAATGMQPSTIQKAVGAAEDGKIGPNTMGAIAAKIGASYAQLEGGSMDIEKGEVSFTVNTYYKKTESGEVDRENPYYLMTDGKIYDREGNETNLTLADGLVLSEEDAQKQTLREKGVDEAFVGTYARSQKIAGEKLSEARSELTKLQAEHDRLVQETIPTLHTDLKVAKDRLKAAQEAIRMKKEALNNPDLTQEEKERMEAENEVGDLEVKLSKEEERARELSKKINAEKKVIEESQLALTQIDSEIEGKTIVG